MAKKILITGSCGFVMSNFIRKALHDKLDYVFASIDKVKNPSGIHNVYANKEHTFYIGNILDEHFLDIIFSLEKPDIVIHAAAEVPANEEVQDLSLFVNSNILGTANIVRACVKSNVERLVYLSSYEVYGSLDAQRREGFKEEDTLCPVSSYAASKASGELILQSAFFESGLRYNILRSCNLFGPRQTSDNFIPSLLKNILEEKKVSIYNGGSTQREWLYVGDFCNALISILNTGNSNEIYNISAGYEFSDIEMFHEVCGYLQKGYDYLKIIERENNSIFRYAVDSSKLKDIGWMPSKKYKDSIAFSINWYLKNKWYIR